MELNLKQDGPFDPAPVNYVLHSFACRAVAPVLGSECKMEMKMASMVSASH